MSQRPFRFLHASDIRLETPPQGLAEVPGHLRESLLEAAYTATSRVFDAALTEAVDFVLFSGDILQPQRAGLRGPLFLAEQCSRLAERQIPVYWAGGPCDPPEAWPAAIPLPQNVHFFPRGRATQLVHHRDGTPLARIVGQSRDGEQPLRPADFTPDPAGLFSIAVAHGEVDLAACQGRGIHYWALGGRDERSTPMASPTVVHYPGAQQGRRPEHTGAHGCTLTQVDEQNHARVSLLATDALRWLSERIVVEEATTRERFETLLRERVRALMETAPKMDLLIAWTVGGSGPLVTELRRGTLGDELLAALRSEFGFASPAAWSVSLGAEPAPAVPASWYEQETILGDFLRIVRQYEMNDDEPIDLESYLAESQLAGTVAGLAGAMDPAARRQVLGEATLLGVELLGGGEAKTTE